MTRLKSKTPGPGLAQIAVIAVVVVATVLALAGVYDLGTRSQPEQMGKYALDRASSSLNVAT